MPNENNYVGSIIVHKFYKTTNKVEAAIISVNFPDIKNHSSNEEYIFHCDDTLEAFLNSEKFQHEIELANRLFTYPGFSLNLVPQKKEKGKSTGRPLSNDAKIVMSPENRDTIESIWNSVPRSNFPIAVAQKLGLSKVPTLPTLTGWMKRAETKEKTPGLS